MKPSINKFENLSLEILLEIFDYLSTTDCFNAFYNLNWKFNSALKLTGLSIDLTSISKSTFDEFYKKLIFANYQRQIRKLKISNDLTLNLLETIYNNFNLRDFKQLRSLTLIKPSYMTLGGLALLIPHFKQLEHLSIYSNSYPEKFFQMVTTISPSIKSCYFPGLEIQDELSFQSKIESLTVTVEDITILLNLLAVFPRLKYLNVSLRSTLDIDEDQLPKLNIISCENLRIFKLQILENSSVNFNEIEYFFQQISFHNLTSFSYNCITGSLAHLDVTRWNQLLSSYLNSIEKFQFFVQIPYNSCSYIDIKQILNDMRTNFDYPVSFSLSINYSYYMIHTDIYPKHHFDLSMKLPGSGQYFNYDPISCDTKMKYSKVQSLTVDISAISACEILPENIKYLHIQGENHDVNLGQCFKDISNQLISLKIFGLPKDLPQMSNLRQLTIQQVMFNLTMASKLSFLCPRLELLTIEIDCIRQFGEIFEQLRCKDKFSELKFIRAFSRDTNQTWSAWLTEKNDLINNHDLSYEVKNLFLFIWL